MCVPLPEEDPPKWVPLPVDVDPLPVVVVEPVCVPVPDEEEPPKWVPLPLDEDPPPWFPLLLEPDPPLLDDPWVTDGVDEVGFDTVGVGFDPDELPPFFCGLSARAVPSPHPKAAVSTAAVQMAGTLALFSIMLASVGTPGCAARIRRGAGSSTYDAPPACGIQRIERAAGQLRGPCGSVYRVF